MALGVSILLIHVFTGIVMLYLMLYDLGVHHKKFLPVATRFSMVGWWLMQLEHLMKDGHFDVRQLVSEVLLLISLILITFSLSSIKKLIK